MPMSSTASAGGRQSTVWAASIGRWASSPSKSSGLNLASKTKRPSAATTAEGHHTHQLESRMSNLRERRLIDSRKALDKVIEQREATIARLVKLDGKIKTLRKQVARYEKLAAQPS